MRGIPVYKSFVIFILFLLLPNQLIFSTSSDKQANLFLTMSQPVIQVNETVDIQLGLMTAGYPLANQFLRVSFDGLVGRFLTDTNLVKTDIHGQAKLVWQAGPYPGKVVFRATYRDIKGSLQQVTHSMFIDPSPSGGEGRALFTMSAECAKGTTIEIRDLSGQVLMILEPDSINQFDTGCTLSCNQSYYASVINKNCQFIIQKMKFMPHCCPSVNIIPLSCECPPEAKGQVLIKLPEECVLGTRVKLFDTMGKFVMEIPPDPNVPGLYLSTCLLTCDAEYLVIPFNEKCQFTPPNKLVKAKCCPEAGEYAFESCTCSGDKVEGKIIVKLPQEAIKNTTVRISLVDSTSPLYLTPNEEGVVDTGCKLKCGEKYRIEPFNSVCTFNPKIQYVVASCCSEEEISPVLFTSSCPPAKTGKVGIKIPVDCVPGTKIYVQEVGGTFSTYLTVANKEGLFESTCTLLCDKEYKVTPYKPNCTFTPASMIIKAACCPSFSIANFEKCSCAPTKTGKISVTLPKDCLAGSKVYISDSQGKAVTVLTAYSSTGVFESTCTLICEETYTVTPYKPNCTFTPASMTVTAKCCPSTGSVKFSACSCEKPKGSIVVKLSPESTPKTKIKVTPYSTTGDPIYLLANEKGLFDTGCVLVCGDSYKVEPMSETCKFTPTYQLVKAICCTTTPPTPISFTSSCPPAKTGKIKVQVPSNSVLGTKIYLIDSQGKGTLLTLGNGETGIFESTCALVCDETYTVQPVNSAFTFSPVSIKVVAKCCPSFGYVTFSSTKKSTMFHSIWFRRNELIAI